MNVITGEMVLPFKYDYIWFEEDKWKVRVADEYQYFSLDGKLLENIN